MTSANRFSPLFKSPAKIALLEDKSSYSDAFPPLLETNESDTTELSPSPKEESAKNIKTKIILGPRSYEDELREKQEESLKQRTEAYGILADKEKLGMSLLKTRMCNSIDKSEPCQHEGNCRFAHDLSELNIAPCLFGENCRFVRAQNGKLFNTGEKVCNHKHPHESRECFLYRVGLNRYKNAPAHAKVEFHAPPPPPAHAKVEFHAPPPPPTHAKVEFHAPPPPPTHAKVEFHAPPPPPAHAAVEFHAPPPPPAHAAVDCENSRILIIRVPRELAARALEIALNNGKTNIQVELID